MFLAVTVHLVMFPIYAALIRYFTDKIIDQIQDSALLSRGRAVYEDVNVGTLTVYEDDAILELLDGSVVVIPRMDEAQG